MECNRKHMEHMEVINNNDGKRQGKNCEMIKRKKVWKETHSIT